MIIQRKIEQRLKKHFKPNKVQVILGARRTGKTILVREFIKNLDEPYILLNGEDLTTHELLSRMSTANYTNLIGDKSVLIIDEAQKISDIGMKLKIMVDNIEGIKIIATGSSVFDMTNKSGEPLTGRKFSYFLYPFSEDELSGVEDEMQRSENLRERLIFGNYPEVTFLKNREEKREYLSELVSSYLFKDILSFENLKSSAKIIELLKLIAFQVGNEVSINEFSRHLGINKQTVERYLDLLSNVFIIYRLRTYSSNLRKEVARSSKWFFMDNGMRNAIISNFSSLENRNDVGKLWENYMVSERIKYQSIKPHHSFNYFWRTYDKQEVDWIEMYGGNLHAYEFKWRDESARVPAGWKNSYPDSEFKLINSNNYFEWLKI